MSATTMTVVCSGCGANIEAGPEYFGTVVSCPACSARLQIPVQQRPPPLATIQTGRKFSGPSVILKVIAAPFILGGTFGIIGAIAAVADLSSRPGREQAAGAGIFMGVGATIVFAFGAFLWRWADVLARQFTCSNCGHPLPGKTAKICGTCKARLG